MSYGTIYILLFRSFPFCLYFRFSSVFCKFFISLFFLPNILAFSFHSVLFLSPFRQFFSYIDLYLLHFSFLSLLLLVNSPSCHFSFLSLLLLVTAPSSQFFFFSLLLPVTSSCHFFLSLLLFVPSYCHFPSCHFYYLSLLLLVTSACLHLSLFALLLLVTLSLSHLSFLSFILLAISSCHFFLLSLLLITAPSYNFSFLLLILFVPFSYFNFFLLLLLLVSATSRQCLLLVTSPHFFTFLSDSPSFTYFCHFFSSFLVSFPVSLSSFSPFLNIFSRPALFYSLLYFCLISSLHSFQYFDQHSSPFLV